ncbi:GTP pyrophosphokinase [Aeromicrobium flavum]|uniref:GTP pyrophosphokinase n=1 Tax=Aeromicrobium flavum TaxID=416568 RepID=A0A512HQD9_9ACTN|nr:GTP pyrophosphokinase family protein [Aeromicrobium flavum]GEO87677.1 GTP pyrophosphokinase [Aeromicrobium flavum]
MTSPDASDSLDLGILRQLAGTPHGPVEWRRRLRETQQQMSAFLMEYKFALDEVETKISILREEFELAHEYSPIEHVKSRLKTVESLVAKVDRLDVPRDLPTIRETIRDIAGIRVSCVFVEDTYRFAKMLTQQQDLTVLDTKDYIAHPKPNGYRSLHLIVELPVFLSDRTVHVPVEVQIRTIAMDFWASVEHRIYYKYRTAVPEDLSARLHDVASTAAELDAQMGRLREEIQSLS